MQDVECFWYKNDVKRGHSVGYSHVTLWISSLIRPTTGHLIQRCSTCMHSNTPSSPLQRIANSSKIYVGVVTACHPSSQHIARFGFENPNALWITACIHCVR